LYDVLRSELRREKKRVMSRARVRESEIVFGREGPLQVKWMKPFQKTHSELNRSISHRRKS
jgi:hypothetical protein